MSSIFSRSKRVRGIECTVSGHGVLWALILGIYRMVIIDQQSGGFRFIILSVEQNIVETQVAVQNPDMIV